MNVQEFSRGHFLTVYILAYENADCVRGLLTSLLPFKTPHVCVIVSDNSDKTDAVLKVTEEFLPQFHGKLAHWHYGVNVGLGNILRPFETVYSPYLWIVGACNTFFPNAIELLLPILNERRPDVLLHVEDKLWRRKVIQEPRIYDNVLSIIGDHSHSIMCSINSLIHNTAKMRPLLAVGYETASSMVPHAAMVYEGLRTGQIKVQYMPIMIFDRPSRVRKWSMRQHLEKIGCVLTAATTPAYREAFYKKLEETDAWILAEIQRLKDPNQF